LPYQSRFVNGGIEKLSAVNTATSFSVPSVTDKPVDVQADQRPDIEIQDGLWFL